MPCLLAPPNPARLREPAQGLLIPDPCLTAPAPEWAPPPWSPFSSHCGLQLALTIEGCGGAWQSSKCCMVGRNWTRVPVRRRAFVRQLKAGKHLRPVAQGHVTSSPGRLQQNSGWFGMDVSPLEQWLSNLPASHSLALVFSSLKWGQECQSQSALVSITCVHLYKTHCTEFSKWQL